MLLGDHNEPCIIDDTPQFSDTAGTVIAYRGRAPATRANPAQTALLKMAYEQSNVISARQAKILAEETGLPPKWILQWFSRRRSKDRKNDVNYKPRLFASTGCKQASNPAAFSAAFFSDSASSALAIGTISAQEIITIKSEYQDLRSLDSTPSISGSTSLEEFQTPLSVSESSSMSTSGHLDMVAHADTGRKKCPIGRKNQNTLRPGRKPKHALDSNTPTKSTDGAVFRFLKSHSPGDTYGLNHSDGVQSGKTEPDTDAYTQSSSSPTSKERHDSTPSAPQISLPHIVPPRRSRIVTPDNGVRSAGREAKTSHRPSRLSVVNMALGESDISLLEEDPFSIPAPMANSAAETFSHKDVARSVSQTQWYNNRLSIGVPRDRESAVIVPEARIAGPVLYSKYLVPTAGNRLSKADPFAAVASSFPDFVELALMDSFTETFSANFTDMLFSIRYDHGSACMGSGFSEGHDRRGVTGGHPSTDSTGGRYTSTINPDYLEALDPSRAPLKHLTSTLTEYRDDDGTYLNLLVGLQDAVRRRKIIECLCNEELILHDPFSAAMGLSLLARLGVL